jgi:hypothetical protein
MVSKEEKTRCQVHTFGTFARSTSVCLTAWVPRAAAEIRDAGDALIAFTEAQQKRDALHAKNKEEIAAKYNQQDRLGGAA